MLRFQNPRPGSGSACPEGYCNASFLTLIIASKASGSKDSSAQDPRFVHLPFHYRLLLGFVAFAFSIGLIGFYARNSEYNLISRCYHDNINSEKMADLSKNPNKEPT